MNKYINLHENSIINDNRFNVINVIFTSIEIIRKIKVQMWWLCWNIYFEVRYKIADNMYRDYLSSTSYKI